MTEQNNESTSVPEQDSVESFNPAEKIVQEASIVAESVESAITHLVTYGKTAEADAVKALFSVWKKLTEK